jgi:hypothetical protein
MYPYSLGAAHRVFNAAAPGVSPCPERGRDGKFLDYCSRDMVPLVGGASRHRETMYQPEMGPIVRYVKHISAIKRNACAKRTARVDRPLW